jgi:hypothetical protein
MMTRKHKGNEAKVMPPTNRRRRNIQGRFLSNEPTVTASHPIESKPNRSRYLNISSRFYARPEVNLLAPEPSLGPRTANFSRKAKIIPPISAQIG